ncbi:hypothetical protein OPT61_g1087 [Boeremia exigua]|uniref:Uncharacterized protein n=1 Tax=Boeremia exigua TaxID=749465 RepID=A0ACC2IRH1_9PLEO|nr:hypothetical protein OPT61_g1087 [Boeremia exigua]
MPMPFGRETWIWYICAIGMIIARLIARRILFRSVKDLQLDDWIMGVFVFTCYTALMVVSNRWYKAGSNLAPPDFDFSALDDHDFSQRIYGSKMMIVTEQMQISVIWSCKACLLIMYYRITRTALRSEHIAIRILIAYVALGYVVMQVLYFAVWCRPFSAYYAVPTSSTQCNTLLHHRIAKAVFNISSDMVMLSIGLQMLIRSKLPWKRKLILCGIFSLGIFVIAAAALSSYYSFAHPYGEEWMFWYIREASMAIIVANMPFTWTLLREMFEVGDFDENAQPWTFHPHARTSINTHRTHDTASSGRGVRSQESGIASHGSRGTQSMTMVGSPSLNREMGESPAKSLALDDGDRDLEIQADLGHVADSIFHKQTVPQRAKLSCQTISVTPPRPRQKVNNRNPYFFWTFWHSNADNGIAMSTEEITPPNQDPGSDAGYDRDAIVASITRYYELLSKMVSIKPKEIAYAPEGGRGDDIIPVEKLRRLGFTDRAIDFVRHVPFVHSERPVHQGTQTLYYYRDYFRYPEEEYDLVEPMMVEMWPMPEQRIPEGFVPLSNPLHGSPFAWWWILDTNTGELTAHGPYLMRPSEEVPEDEQWRSSRPVPATDYFDGLCEDLKALRLLPVPDVPSSLGWEIWLAFEPFKDNGGWGQVGFTIPSLQT